MALTIISIIANALGVPADEIKALAVAGGNAAPDLKPVADKLLSEFDKVATPLALANLNSAIVHELADIKQGKLDGREHPSSGA